MPRRSRKAGPISGIPGEPHCELHQARQLVATRVRARQSQPGEEEVFPERIELEAGSTEEPTLLGAKQASPVAWSFTRPVSDDGSQWIDCTDVFASRTIDPCLLGAVIAAVARLRILDLLRGCWRLRSGLGTRASNPQPYHCERERERVNFTRTRPAIAPSWSLDSLAHP